MDVVVEEWESYNGERRSMDEADAEDKRHSIPSHPTTSTYAAPTPKRTPRKYSHTFRQRSRHLLRNLKDSFCCLTRNSSNSQVFGLATSSFDDVSELSFSRTLAASRKRTAPL